ncbi:MAG: hypothetical protein KDI07_03825 [Anaerolineae bacterium]|nr:hypothetical protein [Anaerolineae bacterium]MCB0247682.1 hypothetical protein [Anaerolineae bacterium]MCO5244362.1 hypothetical protein [Anaerolineae bacterium]
MRLTIWTEIKNLVWLQWRLTVSSFRSGQKQDVLRILGYALLILLLVPGLIIFNALLIWIYRSLAPGPASEVVTVIMSFIIMMWLLTPASNTQLVEPFSMPKLFSFPISLNGLVLGSLVVNLFSVGFLAIIPFLISVSAGTIRSIPGILPTLIAATLFLAMLLVLKSLIDDVFDLIAEDRRLRAIGILVALIPVLFIVGGQFYVQTRFVIPNATSSTDFENFASSFGDLNSFIWNLRISRFLIWQPGGWLGRATGAAAVGRYDQWAAWTALLAVFVVLGYFAHRTMVSKLYFGELVRVQSKGQSSNKALKPAGPKLPFVALASSQALWAFLAADWRGFKRNPYTIRMAIGPVILGIMAVFFSSTMPGPASGIAALLGFTAVTTVTLSYGHNVFGILDNPGLGTVLLSPVPARWLLVSHNMLLTALVAAMSFGAGLLVAIVSRDPLAPLAALGAAMLIQLLTLSVCNFTAVLLPYKVDLEKGRAASNDSRTSVISVFAVLGGMGLLIIPVVVAFAASGLVLRTLIPGGVAAIVYAVAVYAGTTVFAGQLLEGRGTRVLAEIAGP